MSDDKKQGGASDGILDAIEGEAKILTIENGDEGEQPDGAERIPEPEPEPEPRPDVEFDMTVDMTAGGIKAYLKGKYADNPNIEKACKVWDDPMFAAVLVPVLKKYNLTVMNLPVELVLLGGIWKIASDMATILKAGQDAKASA